LKIRDAIGRVWNFLYTLKFVDLLMKSLVLFLFLAVILVFVPYVTWKWAFLVAIIYLFIKARNLAVSLQVVEKENPILENKLTTVADNMGNYNPIVAELQENLLKDLPRVRSANFFDSRKFLLRFSLIFMLSCLLIFTPIVSTGLDFVVLKDQFMELDWVQQITEEPDQVVDFLEDDPLTLKKKNVELVKTEFDLPLDIAFNQIDIKTVEEVEDKDFSVGDYPMDIEAVSDVSYDETIKKKHRVIVKKYFEGINY
jgi:hypothetical protein